MPFYKKFRMFILILAFFILFGFNACQNRDNQLERPDIDISDMDITSAANTRENQVYAHIMDTYSMSFCGLVIKMDYNLVSKRFEGEIQNLTNEPKTIRTLYARYYNGLQSSSVENIVLAPNEIYKLVQVLENEHDFKMWQPYAEVEFENDPGTIRPPSVSIIGN